MAGVRIGWSSQLGDWVGPCPLGPLVLLTLYGLTALPFASAGTFTDWQTPIALRSSSETKDFVRTLALQPGTYQVILHACTK